MKLKVCGMKYQENIAEVTDFQPDYLGFIFYEKSPRFVNEDPIKVPNTIKKTGVFVDASLAYIAAQIERHNLHAVQLHGNESPSFCEELRGNLSFLRKQESGKDENPSQVQNTLEIIKVFSIKDEFDFSVLEPYESVCDYYLFDTKGKLPGGNGYAFDWTILENYPSTKPYFLSGGIGLEDIENLLLLFSRPESKYCYALDINSKFEIAAGLKNTEKLKKFKEQLPFRT